MKKIKYLKTISLLLMFFFFYGCNKDLPIEEKQEIERYKNSPRDSRIIGQWKFKNEKNEEFIINYRLDGIIEQAIAVYNDEGEVIKYKKDEDMEVYFYTESNEIIHQYIVIRKNRLMGKSYADSTNYRIEADSLYIHLDAKGVKMNMNIED
jgi:hypothetical protein